MKKFRFKILSLKQTLLIIIILCVISSFFINDILFIYLYKNDVISKNLNNRIELLTNISASTDSLIGSTSLISDIVYMNIDVATLYIDDNSVSSTFRHNINNANKILDLYAKTNNISYNYAIYLNNGYEYTYKKNNTIDSFDDYKLTNWYTEAISKNNHSIWITNYYYNNKYNSYIVKPITDNAGKECGIFIFSISENEFYKIYSSMIDKNNIYILDTNGKYISHNNTEKLGDSIDSIDSFKKSFNGKKYKTIIKNDAKYLCYYYVDQSRNWTYVEEYPLEQLLQGLDKINNIIIIFSCILTSIFILILFKITSLTVNPLSSLLEQLKKVGSTENNELIFNINGWKEIHMLCSESNRMNKRINQLVNQVKNTEKEKNELKMNYLQAQIRPHFIYNTLFSIKCLIDLKQNENASKATQNFISLLKYSLSYKKQMIYIVDDIKFIEDYISLQNLRYGNCISLKINCDIHLYRYKIMKFILQPLIENSLVHGFTKDMSEIEIVIDIHQCEQNILITITDTGVGFPKNNKMNMSYSNETDDNMNFLHIGLDNIQMRIKQYYKTDSNLKVDFNYSRGAKIDLVLPIIQGVQDDNHTDC